MAATQRDIRTFENEQDAPRAQLPAGLVEEPPGTPGLAPAPASAAVPLGARLPQLQTSSPAMEQAVTGILGGQRALNERLGPLQAGVDARRASLQGELDRPMPDAPKLNQVPQFQPRELSTQDLTMFAGIAMALAGLGTKAMRGDLTMALNAAGSAMKGFNEGNLQQSKLDLENFNKQMQAVVADNHRMSEEYRGIIENRKLSLGQKEQMLRAAAAGRDDQIMLSALATGQLRMAFDLESHRINATNQVSLQATQIYETALHRQQQIDEARNRSANEPLEPVLGPDGMVRYVRRSDAVNQVVPPRNSGDKLTEAEAKGTLFWRQMSAAENTARGIAGPTFDMANLSNQLDVRMAGSDMTNWLASDKAQQYAQSAEQWAEAYLRLKTGAATNADEIKRNARAYFPQPGDLPQTIIQKNQMRANAIQDVSIVAGRGVDRQPGGAAPPAAGGRFTEGQTASGPGGKKIVYRNGSWQPL